ncbi:hypothetical protein L9F63_006349 [Diploptera punctata]|uniref:Uncharacterized protein n=1 Tax=Diploptera punctata TaxID=6984 RepID=A0AAD7ZAG9_DIPPU|nr:hypothetical protein L9F63_006349 [Diploptera punctata]
MDDQVDKILTKSLLQYFNIPENILHEIENEASPRRTVMMAMFHRKMLLPLLVGVTMKLGSLIPLILGKLTFIGLTALMASKLSLLFMIIMGLRKLFSGADGGVSHHVPQAHPHAYQYQDPHAYYQAYEQPYYGDIHGQASAPVPAASQPRKRVAYVIRGRQLDDRGSLNSPETFGDNLVNTINENSNNDFNAFNMSPEHSGTR